MTITRTRNRACALLVAALLTLTIVPSAGAMAKLPARLDPKVLNGPSPRAIVLFNHDVSSATIERLAEAGIRRARVFDAIDGVAVEGPHSAYISIARWRDIVWVDDDSPIVFNNHIAKADTKVDRVRTGTKPLKTAYTGKGVTVAVFDSGVDTTHPDLSDRFAANVFMQPAAVFDPISDGAYSEQYAETQGSTDELGHGTHVSGIVGGSGRAGMGANMSGVAPGATLMNCKIGEGNLITFESIALACFQWILDHRNDDRFPGGIRVVNNSWALDGDLTGKRPLELMVKTVYKAGIVNVFAAGNSGPGANTRRPISKQHGRGHHRRGDVQVDRTEYRILPGTA